ncbi:MAG TPA: ABC transporter permease [Magnetospirillaceae bacterium]
MPRSREGSPWTGLSAVYSKELADHLSSVLMRVLEWLVILSGLGAVYTAVQQLKTTTAEDRFLFLHLFTATSDAVPINFISLIGFLVPLVAIGLGFDSVNGEFNRRTMSRVLAQPIYRDALLFGKFLAGLSTLAISLVALFLLVIGLGLVLLGVPPNGEEVLRAIGFLVASIAYGGVWLAVAMLFSVIFRSSAAAAMCSIGFWLLLTVLWPILVRFVSQAIAATPESIATGQQTVGQLYLEVALSRISPNTLFMETMVGLLSPSTSSLQLGLQFIIPSQMLGTMGTPLQFGQSLLLVWPQLTALIATVIVFFAITYVTFQRQEIRA